MINPQPPARRSAWMFLPVAGVIMLAVLWSAYWFYAASAARTAITDWQAQEARLGRTYSCASPSLEGYPFRIEARCSDVVAELRDGTSLVQLKFRDVVAVAQIYQPRLLIAEVTGPLTIAEPGHPVSLTANWAQAQASFRGTPTAPERISLAVDGLKLERPTGTSAEPLLAATRMELHGRLDPQSPLGSPVLDLAIRLTGTVAPVAGAAAAVPLDADATAKLRGLKSLSLRPLRVQLQELQAAGGRLEITQARLQQADTVALAAGTLGLTARGRLDGTLSLTVAGLEQFLTRSGLDKMLPAPAASPTVRGLNSLAPILGGLDRLVPGLGAAAQNNANARNLAVGLSFLGQHTELEGRQAIALPLRFIDGAAFLGPMPLGQTPPLY